MDSKLPIHISLIPDGNRRWASMKGLPSFEGHRAGAERMFEAVDALFKRGVNYVTVWGFSGDNWKRSEEEIQNIFHLFKLWIEEKTPWCVQNGIRLNHIGRLGELPADLQEAITRAMTLTKDNARMTFSVAFNYSGRTEIIDAIRHLIDSGELFLPEMCRPELDEKLFSRYLYTDGMPDVDLVIRTAGEYRLSNFMLWQTAYSEFFFSDKLWPDFDEKELAKALDAYAHRERRFGGG